LKKQKFFGLIFSDVAKSAIEAQENLSKNTERANTNQSKTIPKNKNCLGVAVILLGICLRVIFSR